MLPHILSCRFVKKTHYVSDSSRKINWQKAEIKVIIPGQRVRRESIDISSEAVRRGIFKQKRRDKTCSAVRSKFPTGQELNRLPVKLLLNDYKSVNFKITVKPTNHQ